MSNPHAQKSPTNPLKNQTQCEGRDVAIDYLRAFVIVLVVFLHAALAYTSFSTLDRTRWVDSSAPVVDTVRWPLLDLPVLYFDTFFMALLFLVSGLFVLPSLERRGSKDFFVARLGRLGIPFVVSALFIAPLAFWPSYLAAAPKTQSPYLATFFTSDGWPVGPPWFLWVLLLFNGLVALIHRFAPSVLAKLRRPPTVLVIFLVSILSFLPLSLVGSHYWWVTLGPFDLQPIRLGLYFAYFLLGIALGTGQEWRRAGWPKHWWVWFILGLLSFFVYVGIMNGIILLPGLVSQITFGTTFAVSCAGTSLGLLGLFRKFARGHHPIFDNLNANAYSIYIVHYAIVLWIQFALLPASWLAWIKFGITFMGGLALSWGTSALLRRMPAVRRVL